MASATIARMIDSPRPTRRRSTGQATRSRRAASPEAIVADLKSLTDQLISENTRLKRELAKLQSGGSDNPALTKLHRQLTKAIGTSPRSTPTPAPKRPRTKITDPDLLQRRRDALTKARAARSEKRAAAAPDPLEG